MRGTKEALQVLGVQGTLEEKENLPDDYDVDRSFRYSTLMEMVEDCESPSAFVEAIRAKQDELQADFDEKKQNIEQELDNRIPNGTRVEVDGAAWKKEGTVRGVAIDRGHVFYEVYNGQKKLGEFKADIVAPSEERGQKGGEPR